MRRFFLLLTIFAVLCAFFGGCAEEERALKIALVPSVNSDKILESGEPLARLLSEKLGRKVEVTVPTSYTVAVEAVGRGSCDVAFLPPLSYVFAHDRYGARLLWGIVRHGKSTYRGEIIARKGVGSVEELKGKRFAFVDPSSSSGYIYPLLYLKDRNVNPDSFFSQVVFAGSHDQVVMAVYSGEVDGGAVFDDARRIVAKSFPDVYDKVVVLGYTDDIPNDVVVVRPGMDEREFEELKRAFKEVSEEESGRKVLMNLYDIEGFASVEDSQFDVVRRAIKELGLKEE